MTSTFLLSIDHGSDTDLLSIAAELSDAAEHAGFDVLSCKPWFAPSTLEATPPTPPDESGQQ
jgi:hypothetical protein